MLEMLETSYTNMYTLKKTLAKFSEGTKTRGSGLDKSRVITIINNSSVPRFLDIYLYILLSFFFFSFFCFLLFMYCISPNVFLYARPEDWAKYLA